MTASDECSGKMQGGASLSISGRPLRPQLRRLTAGVQSSSMEERLRTRSFLSSIGAAFTEAVKYRSILASLCRPYDPEIPRAHASADSRPIVRLPDVSEADVPRMTLAQALSSRRSDRGYSAEALDLAQVAALLLGAVGATADSSHPVGFRRPYPSGGALYPVRFHCLTQRVAGLSRVVHEFEPQRRALVPGRALAAVETALARYFRPEAALVVVLAVCIELQYAKYEELSYKLSLLEAGHAAQNLVLMATALGLRSTTLCYYDDDLINELLGLDGTRSFVCYAVEVGR